MREGIAIAITARETEAQRREVTGLVNSFKESACPFGKALISKNIYSMIHNSSRISFEIAMKIYGWGSPPQRKELC